MKKLAKKLVQAALRLLSKDEALKVQQCVCDFLGSKGFLNHVSATYFSDVCDIMILIGTGITAGMPAIPDHVLTELLDLLKKNYTVNKVDKSSNSNIEILIGGSNVSLVQQQLSFAIDLLHTNFPKHFSGRYDIIQGDVALIYIDVQVISEAISLLQQYKLHCTVGNHYGTACIKLAAPGDQHA